jgi:hypothetical protein
MRRCTRPTEKTIDLPAVLIASLLSAGCFVYQSADPTAIRPNQPIRVMVTNDEGLRLAREFGFGAPVLEGEFAAVSRDSLELAVWVGRDYGATDFATARQTIPLDRQDILAVQLKRFSPKRTVLASLGVAAIGTLLLNRVGVIDLPWDAGTEPTPPPDPDALRLRFRLPITVNRQP